MTESPMPDWLFTRTALTEVLTNLTDELKRVELEVQLEDMHILVEAGEYVLAIEQLCSHIDEYQLLISESDYHLLEEAGLKMEMDPETWEMIKPK